MKAQEYLQQIIYLDCTIKENKERIKDLKERAEDKTSKLSPNKVQSSGSKSKVENAVCDYTVLEEQVRRDEEKKQEILNTINLLKPYEKTVVFKRYVNDLTLKEISRDMRRSYSWVSKVHGVAKKKIQAILDEREKAGV